MFPRACSFQLWKTSRLHAHHPQPSPCPQTGPVDATKVGTYTGSSETELLNKLKEHLPSGGSLSSLSPADGETASAGSIAGGNGTSGQKEVKFSEAESAALGAAEALIGAFDKNVDVARLLHDIRHHAATAHRGPSPSSAPPLPPPVTAVNAVGSGSVQSSVTASVAGVAQLGGKSGAAMEGGSDSFPSVSAASKPSASSSRRRREEVEAEAAKQGASGG